MEARRRGRGALSPLLDGRDDRSEALRLHRICPRLMYVPKSRGEIVEGTLTVQVAEALDGPLKAENAEVEILDTGIKVIRGSGDSLLEGKHSGISRLDRDDP